MSKQRSSKKSKTISYAPAAVSGRMGGKEEILKLTESERVTSFTSTTTGFQIAGSLVNPGLAASFPWLAGHAQLYDKYRFKRLRYRWIPMVSATTSGNVVLAFDHDPYDGFPTNSQTMCSLSYYKSGSIWDECVLDIPCSKDFLFTRAGPVGGDIKTYDMGAFYVSVEGSPATGVLGFLQVDYEIEFTHKNVNSGIGSGSNFNMALFLGDGTNNVIAAGGKYIFNLPVLGYSAGGIYNVVTPDAAYSTFTLPKGKWNVRAKLQVNNLAQTNTANAGGTAVGAYICNSQWTSAGAGYLEMVLSSTGADTFYITNTNALAVNSTGNYCSISFTLLD